MYKRLEIILQNNNISTETLAEATKISYNILIEKLNGTDYFTLDEAERVKEFLNMDISMEELFSD